MSDSSVDFPEGAPSLEDYRPVQNVHRRLLPRRPGRDSGLEQHCTLYASSTDDEATPVVLVLTPIVKDGASLPYYHPAVHHLAFRYIAAETPLLRIEIVPLPNTPTGIDSRIYRICLALLDTLHRYGWGAMSNYKKRVHHDCLIPREEYQDLYLVMRERHKHLVDEWQEVTDPLKHVFEVSINALWSRSNEDNNVERERTLGSRRSSCCCGSKHTHLRVLHTVVRTCPTKMSHGNIGHALPPDSSILGVFSVFSSVLRLLNRGVLDVEMVSLPISSPLRDTMGTASTSVPAPRGPIILNRHKRDCTWNRSTPPLSRPSPHSPLNTHTSVVECSL